MAGAAPHTDPELRSRLADGSLAGTWTLDPSRSTVTLRTKSIWGLVPVNGTFSQLSGQAVISPAGEASGTITVTAASIDTKNKKRDTHLRSADFFDSDKHPEIIFTAHQVRLDGEAVTVTGTLQVRDNTQPLTFPVSVSAVGDDAIELDAQVEIDRSEFGLTFNQLGMMSTKNTLVIKAVFTR